MSTLGSINVKIGADVAGLLSGVNRSRDSMSRFAGDASKSGARVSQALGAVAKSAVSMAETVVRGAVRAGDAMSKIGSQIQGMGQGMSGLGQSLSIGLTAPLGAASAMALKASGDMEQAQISFTTLLGSAQAAGSYIGDLKKFAAATPFEFSGVKQGAQQLLAFGFQAKEVIPILTSIGDGLSAMGNVSEEGVNRAVIALGQMKSSGTVLKQDLNQLIALNIPVFDILSQKLGMTAQEVARIGESGIESSKAITAILEGMNDRFGGSMVKQSQTLMGLWSTMKDQASFIFADIGDSMVEALDLRDRVKSIIDGLAGFLDWFRGLSVEAKQTAIGIGIFLASLGPVLMIAGEVTVALGGLVTVLGFIASPMGIVAAGAVAFVAAMGDALLSSQALRDNLLDQWPKIKDAMGQAWEGMRVGAHAVQLAMQGDWQGFSAELESAMKMLGSSVEKIWDVAFAALSPIVEKALTNISSRLTKWVSELPGRLSSAAGNAIIPAAPAPASWMDWTLGDLFNFATGRQHAAGGFISGPGSGTSDSIAARLSNGEFVVNAAATARNRAALEAINANRFADGGMVGDRGGGLYPFGTSGIKSDAFGDHGGGLNPMGAPRPYLIVMEFAEGLKETTHIVKASANSWSGIGEDVAAASDHASTALEDVAQVVKKELRGRYPKHEWR